MPLTVHLPDLRLLAADFAELARAAQTRVLRQATLADTRVAARAIKASAPVRSGQLKATVTARAKRNNPAGSFTSGVRFRSTQGTYANTARNRRKGIAGQAFDGPPPAYYWRFTELGTSQQPARPFIRPAVDGAEHAIIQATVNGLAQAIDRAIGKQRARR